MSAAADDGVVFDAYAWVEYIAEGKHAKKVQDLLDDPDRQKVTPATVLTELAERLLRAGTEKTKIGQAMRFIESRTRIYPCGRDLALYAGQVNFEQKKKVKGWGMLDSLNYAVASTLNYSFVTGDPHFKNIKGVIFLN